MTAPLQIVLATRNQGKLREIRELVKGLPVGVLSMADFPDAPEVVEDADTFSGNAEKKARKIHQYTGLVAVADDSGLCVDHLRGEPGVLSARYSGENATDATNNEKLLAALAGVPKEKRTARFVCCVCVYPVQGAPVFLEGEAKGVLLESPRGENGFGYDPLFLWEPEGLTFAELPAAVKNRVSHRANAFAGLADALRPLLAGKTRE